MLLTCNTYGLRSINTLTFNGVCDNWDLEGGQRPIMHSAEIWAMPVKVHDYVTTLLRINNLLFNALGYHPETKRISGLVRTGIGCAIVGVTLLIGTPLAGNGPIVGRWYEEALMTGIAQAFRGCMEALVPYGRVVNGCLDTIGTIGNIQYERFFAPSKGPYDYPDPSYWLPFQFLRLV